MSAMTRRKFLKRTGAASVACLVMMNAERAAADPPTVGTGSSYYMEANRKGGFARKTDTYNEEWANFSIETIRINPATGFNNLYNLKLKWDTTPASGKSNSAITITYAGEVFPVNNQPNSAAPCSTATPILEAIMPDDSLPQLNGGYSPASLVPFTPSSTVAADPNNILGNLGVANPALDPTVLAFVTAAAPAGATNYVINSRIKIQLNSLFSETLQEAKMDVYLMATSVFSVGYYAGGPGALLETNNVFQDKFQLFELKIEVAI